MKMGRIQFTIALWPDLKETVRSLYRTFRGDPERARIVLGTVCEHAWRLEFEYHTREQGRGREGPPRAHS